MIQQNNTLTGLAIGESGIITAVGGEGALRQHFLDMGLIPGVEVSLEKYAPMGDPMQLKVAGYELTLRVADGEKITVRPLNADEKKGSAARAASAGTVSPKGTFLKGEERHIS